MQTLTLVGYQCGVLIYPIMFVCFSEALPFYLLLIDLSKASALAKMAFKAKTKARITMTCTLMYSIINPSLRTHTHIPTHTHTLLLIGRSKG